MQAAAGVLALWDAVAVEPFAASKDLAYVVLTPQAGDLSVHVRAFVREVASAYQACRLGRLLPLEHEGLTAGGLLEVPLPTPKVDAGASTSLGSHPLAWRTDAFQRSSLYLAWSFSRRL